MPTGTEVEPDILRLAAKMVEEGLDRRLPPADEPPTRLHAGMRDAVLGGGKRVRPALALAACRAVGGEDTACLPAMCALECLHAYTLVHDDLPAMDDDDIRRGRPTCHVVHGEATAILVGDALQAFAFEILAPLGGDAVALLATAGGSRGVVGGQEDDLRAEREPPSARAATIARIHERKTAALIRAACELGGIAGGGGDECRAALATYGVAIGLAFQITDDVLDCTASSQRLGKTAGKDAAAGKLTWVAVHGVDGARRAAAEELARAEAALAAIDHADELQALGRFVVHRDH